jgi:hypothetical protein
MIFLRKYRIVFFVVCFLLVTLGSLLAAYLTSPAEGIVKDKSYTAGEWDRDCKKVNGKTKCTTEWDEEVCQLFLVNGRRQGWVEISCSQYPEVAIGSYYRG